MSLFNFCPRNLEQNRHTRVNSSHVFDPNFAIAKQKNLNSTHDTITRICCETLMPHSAQADATNVQEITAIVISYLDKEEFVDSRLHPDISHMRLLYLSPKCKRWEDAKDVFLLETHRGDESRERNGRAVFFISQLDDQPLTLFFESHPALCRIANPIQDIAKLCPELPLETPAFGWDRDNSDLFAADDAFNAYHSKLSLMNCKISGIRSVLSMQFQICQAMLSQHYQANCELQLKVHTWLKEGILSNFTQKIDHFNTVQKVFVKKIEPIMNELLDWILLCDRLIDESKRFQMDIQQKQSHLAGVSFAIRQKLLEHTVEHRESVAPNGRRAWFMGGNHGYPAPSDPNQPYYDRTPLFKIVSNSEVAILGAHCQIRKPRPASSKL